ncbi:MAG: carbohydrate ABC transporter permease [Clostridiales bacterium]|nr:carbohydrate ABC transporter permease [Clostridiales bacterium]
MDATRKLSRKNAIKVPRGDKIYYGIVNLFLFLFFMAILLPLINVVASSFSEAKAVNQGKVLFWPVQFTTKGYKAVFEYRGIWRSYANTFLYTITGTAVNLAMTLMCAYPLARKDLPFKGPVVALFMFTMLFGGGTIPNYILIRNLHMMNTIWAMIIPGAISVYNMIIARTFIQNIPSDLEEAAKIDGCSDVRYFFSIVLPLSKTVISVLGLYYAVAHWNDYFTAFLYLSDNEKMPLQITLRAILINNSFSADAAASIDEETLLNNQALQDLLKYSLIIVSSVPVLIIYPFVKKYFLKGVMLGAVKG